MCVGYTLSTCTQDAYQTIQCVCVCSEFACARMYVWVCVYIVIIHCVRNQYTQFCGDVQTNNFTFVLLLLLLLFVSNNNKKRTYRLISMQIDVLIVVLKMPCDFFLKINRLSKTSYDSILHDTRTNYYYW